MKLRGDGININRYRATKDDDSNVHLYLDVHGEYTLDELLEYFADELGLRTKSDLADIKFRGGCYVIQVPSTEEDRETWRKGAEKREQQALKSRRDWYEKLKAEFEPDA